MSLIIVLLGILFLLFLMLVFKLNAFISLIIVSLAVGFFEGMGATAVLDSIVKGVGSTMGSLALILAFGAMLGKILEISGAAQKITYSLIGIFGEKNIQWPILITGILVGIPLVYNAGFLVLIPLIYAISTTARIPVLYLGIPMAAALSTTHGLLPPHPAPTAIAILYKADVNLTLFYGFLIALPAVVLSGPLLSRFFKHLRHGPPQGLFEGRILNANELPGLGLSIFISLLPVLLMLIGALANHSLPPASSSLSVFKFFSDPTIALLLAVLAGLFFLGYRQGRKMDDLMQSLSTGVGSIAMILLIIASGGAFKQVLVDSGIGKDIQEIVQHFTLSPLVLVWTVAALLRLALGSATVAAITAAGMIQPILGNTNIQPELMVLATSAGSLMFSHVNDIGFWMFKEYFNLSIKQTFATWTVMETIVAVCGLAGAVLIHNMS